MKKSVGQKLAEIVIYHEVEFSRNKTCKINANLELPFEDFVKQLDREIVHIENEGERRYFINNNQEIDPTEKKTLKQLEVKQLIIKSSIYNRLQSENYDQNQSENLEVRVRDTIQLYQTKIASSSLSNNLDLKKDVQNLDRQITEFILSNPDLQSSRQDENLKQQAYFFMKRHIEEEIQENLILSNQDETFQTQDQNSIGTVIDVLKDQLMKGQKELVIYNYNGSIKSLQVGCATYRQKICEIKLNIDEQSFQNLFKVGQEKKFIEQFQTNICNAFNIQRENINILGLEKGSIKVQFVIKGNQINETDYQELSKIYDQKMIDFQQKPFFNRIGLSKSNFDFHNNEDWTNNREIDNIITDRNQTYRDQQDYKINNICSYTGPNNNPLITWCPFGWKAYGLNVKDNENIQKNQWLNEFGEGAWYKVYALTNDSDSEKIQDRVDRVHPVQGLSKTRVFNKVEFAEKNCKITQRDQQSYKMLLQCRVYPGKLMVNNQPYDFNQHKNTNEFYVEEVQHFRIEKILLKNMTNSCAKFTECLKNSCSLI